ncbi:MAG: hypothetical protein AAFY15_00515 [Cyanobacteria bacterium J06648_11]
MASINIYVSDELKERMQQATANWSEVCRAAIEAEIARVESLKKSANGDSSDTEDWVSESVGDLALSDSIIKPVVNKAQLKTDELDHWRKEFNKRLSTNLLTHRLDPERGTGGHMLNGSTRAAILVPGRQWLTGRLKMTYRLDFLYPEPEQ